MTKFFNFNKEEMQKRFESVQKSFFSVFLLSMLPPVPLHFAIRAMKYDFKTPATVTDNETSPSPKC